MRTKHPNYTTRQQVKELITLARITVSRRRFNLDLPHRRTRP